MGGLPDVAVLDVQITVGDCVEINKRTGEVESPYTMEKCCPLEMFVARKSLGGHALSSTPPLK